MTSVSPLKPTDPASLPDYEKEEQAPWVMRKLVGSMIGRIVVSSLATLKATGTNIICLSWGDSSPLILPCIMWRDVILHTVVVATGGTAAIAAPAMSPLMDTVVSTIGDSIVVEMGLHTGFEISTKASNTISPNKARTTNMYHPVKHAIPVHSKKLETTGVKTLLITAPYKHNQLDAALGYFRASVHAGDAKDGLFSSISDYLSIEKGWWNPVLYASGRRPCIPRNMKPDIIFCHGPFHQSDYRVAQQLVYESALVISFAEPAQPLPPPVVPVPLQSPTEEAAPAPQAPQANPSSNVGPVPTDPPADPPIISTPPLAPPLRRLAILLVGIGPHRKLWATSARPHESVISYSLLNGAPAIVVPAKDGCPLMAWDTLTLEHLHKIGVVEGKKFDGIVDVLMEYVSCCADWDRFDDDTKELGQEAKAQARTKEALTLLVAAAIRSKDSKEVKKHIDSERAGIVMLRLP
ncbi:hypothetical protein DL93DRAFT_2130017 [Clavulina sp. PMI_390]|nr:hypothetical protein DL93DRAFT_2130017 [Clavulina sp. PMI_390]